jgi:uncharacterized membrane protein YeiB
LPLEEMGLLENGTLPQAVLAALAFFVVSVAFAVVWRRKVDRGPVEWLMRRIAG